jgi:hypothetical protein
MLAQQLLGPAQAKKKDQFRPLASQGAHELERDALIACHIFASGLLRES